MIAHFIQNRRWALWRKASVLALALQACGHGSGDIRIRVPVVASAPRRPALPTQTVNKPRAVVFFLGDGMGISHLDLARRLGPGFDGRLAMEDMPVFGLVKTDPSELGRVTDSAAGATALFTGVKTRVGALGVASDGSPRVNLLELAAEAGLGTGIVTSAGLTDATTGALVAHLPSRDDEAAIARAVLFDSPARLIMGGSTGLLAGNTDPLPILEDRGFEVAIGGAQVSRATRTPLFGLVDGLDGTERKADLPGTAALGLKLEGCARKALELLEASRGAERGWILFVEEDGIDTHSHDQDFGQAAKQVLELDAAVEVALRHAAQKGDVLVLVTADHETGGLSLIESSNPGELIAHFSTPDHSAQSVPLFAYGPGAEQFGGLLDNTEIAKRLAELLGLEGLGGTPPEGSKEASPARSSEAGGR